MSSNPYGHNLTTSHAIISEAEIAAANLRARVAFDALEVLDESEMPPECRAAIINLARLGFVAGIHRIGGTRRVYLPAATMLGLAIVDDLGHISLADWRTHGERISYALLDAAAKAACAAAEAAKGVR